MELFEKAHVQKNKCSSKIVKKSEEKLKKQIKQMLFGYKLNDNEAIKSSISQKLELDDDISVSSYSGFMNTTKDSSASPSDEKKDSLIQDISLSEADDADTSQELGDDYASTDEDDNHNQTNNNSNNSSLESKHDYENYKDNMSRTISVEGNISKLLSDDESYSVESISTPNSDSDLEPFDADGMLASKIFEKLGKKVKIVTKPKQTKKRKVEPEIVEDHTSDLEEIKDLNISDNTGGGSPADLYDDLSMDGSSSDANPEPLQHSPAFVIIEATEDASTPSFTDILQDYKYSTIKNLSDNVPIINGKAPGILFSSELVSSTNQDENEEVDDNSDRRNSNEILDMSGELVVNTDDSSLEEINTQSMDCSMDDPYNSMHSEDILQRAPSVESLDTSLINPIKVYCCKNTCIIVLKHPAELYFHGKVKVTPLGGTVQIHGHILKEPQEIYAPNCNYAEQIQTLEHQNSYYGLFGKLTAVGLPVIDTEDIVTTLGEFDAVLKLEPLKNRKIDFVQSNFNITDLFTKQSKTIDRCLQRASELLGCSLYLTRPYRYFEENPSWGQAVKYGCSKYSRGVVFGGKGTGKSTFLRYYVNQVLASGPVLLIDLDPGQCELTVAGCVSATVVRRPLLGPNFTHLRTPDRMLNIGMVNVMDNLKRYVNAVSSLICECRGDEQFQNMPWIVNTMGMCNTVGLKLAALITLYLQPTFLLQMDSKNIKKRFECYLNANTIKNLYFDNFRSNWLFRNVSCSEHFDYSFVVAHQYSDSVKGNFSLSARDERYLNLLAYFGGLLDVYRDIDILGITPYEVPLQSLNVCANVKLDWGAIHKVINGKVIALCQQTPRDNVGKMFTLSDKPLLSHGHGLIRGIDYERGLLYVITPVASDKLSLVNTLLYADWMPELRGLEKQLPEGTPIPYRTATLHQQKQLMFTPRRRFNPIQFLKMSRSS